VIVAVIRKEKARTII
jgi:hypothetical protein